MSNSVISGNSAISAFGDGGGIFGKSAVTLSNATLITNVAGDEGGGVWAQGDIDVSASTILSNSALGDDGGGIASIGGDITVNSSLLSGNSAGDDGGGLESGTGNVAIANSTLSGNVAGQDGGGIDSNFGSITLTNAIVSGNSATRSGGGIYSNGDVTLSGSTVSGNTTFFDGGGIRSRGNVTVTNAVIMDNISTFDDGGGIAGDGDITVNNSTIANNFASRNGGGLYSGGTTTISGSTISENTAINDGGGLYSSGDITVTNSTFSGNVAEDGGGIRNRGNVTLTNSTLSGNSALRRGGAIHSFGGAVTLLNATIAFNVADLAGTGPGDGGGIYVTGTQNNQIANSIIASNLGPGGSASDLRADLSSSTVQNSLIQSTARITGATLTTGIDGNVIGQDPLLAPLANNGGNMQTHALLPGSPALNTGNNSLLAFALTTDQAGRPRILDGTVDIGAFEGIVTDLPLPTTPSGTPPTAPPTPIDLNSLTPLNTLEQISRETVSRDRISALLANNQICEAAATLDQYHTQSFAQHFGRFQAEKAISCTQMQQRLADDSALLYVFAQTDKLHLISLTSEDDPRHYELPLPRDVVFAELAQFQHILTNPVLRRSDRFLASAQRLYQWMIQPLLPEFEEKGIHNILFGLDDGLRTLPIAALHDGEQFLIEQYQATLIPSLTLTPTDRPDLQGASVLAMGISAFNQLAPLPAVPVELTSIKKQFPNGASLQNEQATLTNFQSQLQTQPTQIVHLATHGNFQPGRAEDSYIQFWDEQLDLQQIAQIDWSDAAVELLVLSACQTALGDASMEYGFAGLAVQAQAGAAIAGLWGANDTATLALMSEFYRQLSLGKPKGEALRQAQLALLHGTVRLEGQQLVGAGKDVALPQELQELGDRTFWHPYYWSAFTLIGNPW